MDHESNIAIRKIIREILTLKRQRKLITKPYTSANFADKLEKMGFIWKNGSYKAEVLIKGDGDEFDRMFEIPVYGDPDDVSVWGTNMYEEEADTMEIYFKDIEAILKDLNS